MCLVRAQRKQALELSWSDEECCLATFYEMVANKVRFRELLTRRTRGSE
jgi:hypothetical protein